VSPESPESGAPAGLLGELVRLSTAISEVLARELGLSLRDLAALHLLVGRDSRGPAALARELGISTASATVMVDRLEQAGCLQRRTDPNDRRRVVLEATPEMAERSQRAVVPMTRALAQLDASMTAQQREVVTEYLTEAAATMRGFLAETTPRR